MEAIHRVDMEGVRVYQFSITGQARELISFGIQPGAQLRGALYTALARQFCSETGFEHTPGHHSRCPVCWLLANEDPDNARGRDLPRPLIIRPPLNITTIHTDDIFTFGVDLVGKQAFSAFKFVIRGLEAAGKQGVGFQRGRFTIRAVDADMPFQEKRVSLLENGRLALPPELPVMHQQIAEQVAMLPDNRVTLRFLTPLRIGEQKHLCHSPSLGTLLRRLVERCQAMATHYGDGTGGDRERWRELHYRLGACGDAARLVYDDTRWIDIHSGSRRRGALSPISGLVGVAIWEGDLAEALPWLLWGQVLHVGKSTVKGNGWYIVEVN